MEKDIEYEINILFILKSLFKLKTIRNIIISGIVFGVLFLCYSKYRIPEQYTSQISMYVNNNTNISKLEKVEVNDINASQKIVESCAVILKDDIVMKEISNRLLEGYSYDDVSKAFNIKLKDGKYYIPADDLKNVISFSVVNETEILNAKVKTKSPEMSFAVLKAIMDIAPDMIERIINGGKIEPIGEPRIPEQKSSPNNTKSALLGGFTGVFIMLAFYVICIMFDNKIKTGEDLKQRCNIPVFSEIPLYNNKKVKKYFRGKKKYTDVKTEENAFSVTEAYNSLCSNLLFSCRVNENKVIVVSSSYIGDGKSATAYRIAEKLSSLCNSVLLVDCDMRRPSLNHKINTDNKTGLSTILSGETDFGSTVLKISEKFNIVTSGPTPPNVTEAVSSRYMDELMEECLEKYDYIILDTPPINMVNDACILSKYSSGILFVVKSDYTKYKDIEKAEDNLRLVGSKIMGIVVNGVNENNIYSYKYKNYKYYGTNSSAVD